MYQLRHRFPLITDFPMVFSTSYTCLGIDCCHFPVFRCLTSYFATCLGIDFYRFPVFRCLTSYFATCRASIASISRFFDALLATSPPAGHRLLPFSGFSMLFQLLHHLFRHRFLSILYSPMQLELCPYLCCIVVLLLLIY